MEHAKGKLPEGFEKDTPTPPPPPVDENDIIDLSIDLNAVSIDADIPLSELDDNGIERVPMADPGMDVSRTGYV
jgi:serine/threonine-protein phosphatase 2A regulatory subunit B'